MAHGLSPRRAALINAVYAFIFILVVVGVVSPRENLSTPVLRAGLLALFTLAPVISAVFCRRFSAVLLGTLGLAAGILAAACVFDLFSEVHVAWTVTMISVVGVSAAALVLSLPMWWWIGRRRCGATPGAPLRAPADEPASHRSKPASAE